MREAPCAPAAGGPPIDTVITISAFVTDNDGGSGVDTVTASWTLASGQSGGTVALSSNDGTNWSGTFTVPMGTLTGLTTLTVTGTAVDAAGNASSEADSSGGNTFVTTC